MLTCLLAFLTRALGAVGRTLALAALLGATGAAAQTTGANDAAGRAPRHTVPDTLAQRVEACTVCHGKEGRATREGYFPRIAGKPAGYLYEQLLNFREGRRQNVAMGYLVEHLSDDYLRAIAEHFATLDLPYAAEPPSRPPAAQAARGEALVRQGDAARQLPACVQCHGSAMTGVDPSVPGLLGLPRDYLVSQLGAWKTGQRHARAPDCMAQVAATLQPEDIAAVASWLAAQPLPAVTKAVAQAPGPWPMPCGGVAP